MVFYYLMPKNRVLEQKYCKLGHTAYPQFFILPYLSAICHTNTQNKPYTLSNVLHKMQVHVFFISQFTKTKEKLLSLQNKGTKMLLNVRPVCAVFLHCTQTALFKHITKYRIFI